MSKELAFTDDNDVVKYLDTTTSLNLALTADGLAFDLTNAKTIVIKIANDDGYIMDKSIDLTKITNLLNGTIIFLIDQEVMTTLVPDDYDIEVWVTMNDGTQAIFPSDGTLGFSIEENLMSDTGEVIPTITLNDFQQQFNDLSSQMENAVHNVQKGDQGNPGNGIKAANNQYQLSDSPVTVPTGNWSDNILATTDQLPYLWTKIIFIYDDGTTKETNFVSSRGDTGSQGPIGPVGPQGKQGNGLVVRGKADKEENLPTTGNNQGDGYLVGTSLYIWIDGSWQNMGSITPDLADYVKVTDMNNALSTKANMEDVNQQLDKKVNIADMRKPANDVAGIEEVSTLQTQVDNSAVGTNLYIDTKNFDNPASWWGFNSWTKTTDTYNGFGVMQTTQSWNGLSQYIQVKKGDVLTYSVYAKNISGTGTSTIYWELNNPPEGSYSGATASSVNNVTITDSWQRVSGTAVATSDGYLRPRLERNDSNPNTLQIAVIKVEKGSVATDWCPNPSEILTESDDSKVAHLSGANNFDTVPTVNNNPLLLASSLPSDLARTGQDTNFTGKLQKSGIDVATTTDVSNAINTAVSPLNTNTNWTSLSVDSSQTSNDDWDSNNTNFQYRICNSALYLTGQYAMLSNSDSSHNSTTLFQLSSDITSKISFPSTNKFPIGILQQLSQQATMDMISLTSDGKIVCATSPYELNTSGATLAAGYISATIPLN